MKLNKKANAVILDVIYVETYSRFFLIQISWIGDSTLRLQGCIKKFFNYIWSEQTIQIQMAGSEWGIYERHLVEVNLNGLSY